MLTGKQAYQVENITQLARAYLEQTPPAPREIQPDISAGLDRIILRMIAVNREERYESCKAVVDDLKKLTLPEGTKDTSLVPKLASLLWRRHTLYILFIVLVSAITITFWNTVKWWGWQPPQPVAYWSFDDLSDPGHDDTGKGNDLIIPGTYSSVPRFGRTGFALDFNNFR
ncbi:MAG: hypothetical protein GY869_13685, partial [Planctomycetes bacterium]|nr:hypothetical protein [Planctomycetota bacterium]